MKSECATIKNDSEQIKEIHSKWKNADIQQTQIGQIKKLQLSFTEQKNLDFQLPDVFVTTKRILAKPQKSMKINKKTSFSFETSLNNNLQSKQQRNLELTSLQTKYQKFKDLSCSVRTTPQKDSHNQCQSILKNQNFYEIDGIKFPFGLYSMHKKRRNQIQDLLYSNNQQKQKKLDNNDQIQFESDLVQRQNRLKEYKSRSFLENAYFSIICANKNCRYRIKIKIQDSHSIKSRFQQF